MTGDTQLTASSLSRAFAVRSQVLEPACDAWLCDVCDHVVISEGDRWMSDVWSILVAGLGGSAITGAVSLAILERQASHQRTQRRHEERRKALTQTFSQGPLTYSKQAQACTS